MSPFTLDPFKDPRWQWLVEQRPDSSVFHSNGWLEALHRTYGYRPVVLSTSCSGPLENGLVFCDINSWITGRRWVSLPFSDHCEPLINYDGSEGRFLSAISAVLASEKLRYVEVRSGHLSPPLRDISMKSVLRSTCQYHLHQLDLEPDLNTIYGRLHKDSTQRKIRRAARESLGYEAGNSGRLLDVFLGIQVMTRRRHGLPAQPKEWFGNILKCLGQAAQIRVAYHHSKKPIAAIMTLQHNNTIVYKYAGSDAAYHNLGAMQMLLWKTIEEAKKAGFRTLDLGRSDWSNSGLVQYKLRWGALASVLCYSRFTSSSSPKGVYPDSGRSWLGAMRFKAFRQMPTAVSSSIGKMMYRHIG